jgi:adenylate cyclase
MGEQLVKNIKDPIRAYQVRLQPQEQLQQAVSEFQEFELPDKPSIAVLPFTNMSGDPEILTRMEEGLRKAGLPE